MRFLADLYQLLGAANAPEHVLDNLVAAVGGERLPHHNILTHEAFAWARLAEDASDDSSIKQAEEKFMEDVRRYDTGGTFFGDTD